jgi:hypothetical protein
LPIIIEEDVPFVQTSPVSSRGRRMDFWLLLETSAKRSADEAKRERIKKVIWISSWPIANSTARRKGVFVIVLRSLAMMKYCWNTEVPSG